MISQSASVFRRHPIVTRAAVVIGSLAVTMLVVDLVAFYVLGLRRLGHGPERFFQYSSLLGWEHKPFGEGTWYAYKDGTRTHVRINAYGFADAERHVRKDRRRIALIGDSTTEFWEVEESERGQHVMDRLLDNDFEVLNFGLRGAGTDQELIRYTHQVVHFSPDIVVLFFCVNDFSNNVTTDSKPYFVLDAHAPGDLRLENTPVRGIPPAPTAWLRSTLSQSFTLRRMKYLVEGVGTHLRTSAPLESHFELRPFKRVYDAEDDRRLELLKKLIEAFTTFSREHSIHFLLVEGLYRPALDEEMRQRVVEVYGDQFDFDSVSRVLAEHSAVAGYEFLSLPRVVRQRRIDVRQLMHPEDTMHLNVAGVRLFAETVVEKLRHLQWIDKTPGVTDRVVP